MKNLSCQDIKKIEGGVYPVPCALGGAFLGLVLYLNCSGKGTSDNPVSSKEMWLLSGVAGSVGFVVGLLLE
jgi:hypothetical protein